MPLALVLEEKGRLTLRPIDLPLDVGPQQVKIAVHTVGICGSDVHYYTRGRIGPFVVTAPMVLGHEASGTVVEIGADVTSLKVGDRVCMEPGIPDPTSRAAKLGLYNLDPALTFWATPPDHGCLTAHVVLPAAYTYKLPDNVSFAEGAMVEPLAVGMQAASRARLRPGDVGLVVGAGPIGVVTALAALAGGCAKVYIADVVAEKLAILARYPGLVPINAALTDPAARIAADTDGWGVDVLFECSGHASVYPDLFSALRPGGCAVFVGMPAADVSLDLVGAIVKEARMETVFRYANVYDRAINLLASGKIDLKPLISDTYAFADAIAAFDRAVAARPGDVKLQIRMVDGP